MLRELLVWEVCNRESSDMWGGSTETIGLQGVGFRVWGTGFKNSSSRSSPFLVADSMCCVKTPVLSFEPDFADKSVMLPARQETFAT